MSFAGTEHTASATSPLSPKKLSPVQAVFDKASFSTEATRPTPATASAFATNADRMNSTVRKHSPLRKEVLSRD